MENGKSGLRAKLPGGLNVGIPGRGIASIVRTGGSGAPGTDDTYTITYTDGTTSTFTVHNGADGKTAYQYAVDGGYTGSEEDFAKQLAGGGNGSGYMLPVATAEKLGGVKAVAATEEMTEEVGIDAEGKLKVKPGGAGDGLSSEEKTLILSLFKNAAYTADMSATIAQLESMWSGGTVEPDVPDDPDVGISQVGSILTISGVADITKVAQSGTVLTMT